MRQSPICPSTMRRRINPNRCCSKSSRSSTEEEKASWSNLTSLTPTHSSGTSLARPPRRLEGSSGWRHLRPSSSSRTLEEEEIRPLQPHPREVLVQGPRVDHVVLLETSADPSPLRHGGRGGAASRLASYDRRPAAPQK